MIIFVGDKPSPRMKPGAIAFDGARCKPRLDAWTKLLKVGFHKRWNSTDPAVWFIWAQDDGDRFVALGNNAAKFLTKHGIPHFKLPHPSGLNRQINDKSFVAKKLLECKKWLKS